MRIQIHAIDCCQQPGKVVNRKRGGSEDSLGLFTDLLNNIFEKWFMNFFEIPAKAFLLIGMRAENTYEFRLFWPNGY